MDIDIKRNGSRPSQRGPARLVHRNGTSRSALPGAGSRARRRRPSHFRTRCPYRLAHASARANADQVEEIRPGDVVWFPPGLKHWHGASATTAMTHIAIQESIGGKNADWFEKVSDEQYRK